MGNNQSSTSPEEQVEAQVPDFADEESAASVVQKFWKTKQAVEFKWPDNLYLELLDMVNTDQLVYYVSLLFKAARQNEVGLKGMDVAMPVAESAKATEKPKLTLAQVLAIVEANKDLLSKKGSGFDANPEDMIKALQRISDRTSARKVSLVALDSFNLKKQDMSYCIIKDDKLKRVTVVFPHNNVALSGDWVNKRSFKMTQMKLPRTLKAKVSGDRIDSCGIHQGFGAYLNDELKAKIVDDLLTVVTPKYKVYVTGQGMGAPLASLFAFHLAFHRSPLLDNQPVTCINFGSPRVGDSSYWRACQLLEIAGKLRKCRVLTDTDALPTVPASSDYAHAGYQLRLTTSSSASSTSSKSTASSPEKDDTSPLHYYPSVKDDGSNRKGAFASTKKFKASKSNKNTYLEAIESNQAKLKEMNLNQMYEQAGVPAFSD
eukprot:CAMPEP_0198140698 /NCGR_PEP_ID=MMETSP1443-20131203/3829_1 /TAXON_ID=186043 /ORGANISM="Entomoneis sp., Strain CCMP2396" /LENGTH=430 /DNA_ID=CAMNT_0043803209 /DNA_START=38 /DNA_END=1330 /DNA_ORIENTATION=-